MPEGFSHTTKTNAALDAKAKAAAAARKRAAAARRRAKTEDIYVPSVFVPGQPLGFDPAPARPKPPKPQRSVVFIRNGKKPPKPPGHKPDSGVQLLNPQLYARHLLGDLEEGDKQLIVRTNQERLRREEAARKARAEREREILTAVRREGFEGIKRTTGKNQSIDDFVEKGRRNLPSNWEKLQAVAKGVAPELDDWIDDLDNYARKAPELDDWIDDLPAAAIEYHPVNLYRKSVQEGVENYKRYGLSRGTAANFLDATDWVDPVMYWAISPETMKAVRGEDYNPALMAAELSLAAVPVKGVPSVGSVLLRKALGFKGTEKIFASSRAANYMGQSLEAVGLSPDNWFVQFVRNDPNQRRVFRYQRDGVVRGTEVADYAKSRVGRARQQAADAVRPATSKAAVRVGGRKVPMLGVKSENELFMKKAGKRTAIAAVHGTRARVGIEAALGGRVARIFDRLDSPDHYAIRMVGRNIDPATMVNRLRGLAQKAADAGNAPRAARLNFHADMTEIASTRVRQNADGTMEFSDQASNRVRKVYAAVETAAGAREQLLANLDKLTAAVADARINNEELFWHGAVFQPTQKYVDEVIQAEPNRRALLDILTDRVGVERASKAVAFIDNMAMAHMRSRYRQLPALIDAKKAEVAADPSNPTLRRELLQLEREQKVGVDPGRFYRQWRETHGAFVPEDMDALRNKWGVDIAFADTVADEPLKGLPPKGNMSTKLRNVAARYMEEVGFPYRPPRAYVEAVPERGANISSAYDDMVDIAKPPEKKSKAYKEYEKRAQASYAAFKAETLDQYKALIAAGRKVEFYPVGRDPYDGSPWGAMRDLDENDHVYIFPTDEGFGSLAEAGDHPLLELAPDIFWRQEQPDGTFVMKQPTYNDVFRYVHDEMGHKKEGVGFRASGEENAWRSHAAMYSDLARGAMTTETRGQNSWVNFGPHAAANKTADQTDTVYADQKAGLLPDWVSYEGAADPGDPAWKEAEELSAKMLDAGLDLPEGLTDPRDMTTAIYRVFQMAEEGEGGKDWYKTAADGVRLVSEHTGVDVRKVAQLFAIYSQAADTVANSTFVFKAIREWQRHGDSFVGRFPTRQSVEANSVMEGGTWEGRKRSAFYANILRHIPGQEAEYEKVLKEMAEERGSMTNPVTVDRWVVRMFAEELGDVPGKYYDAFEKIMQGMAAVRGWEPEQIQAAAWVTMKDRGLQRELREGKRVTHRHLAGANDAFEWGILRQIQAEEQAAAQGTLFAGYETKPQAKRLANQANKKWGGFTVNRDLSPVPEEGYSVTYSLTETPFPLHGLKGGDIEVFADRYKGMLKDSRNKIGGFSDDANETGDGTDMTYLSVARVFKRKADAMKFAREQGQETFYEYKTGNGIRTGLSREEQGAIIRGLAPDYLRGAPSAPPPPLPAEKAYDDFLARAAIEFNMSRKKIPTEGQKARAEEWMLNYSHEYPDEPIVQEWEGLYAARMKVSNEPEWMLEDATQGPALQGMGRQLASAIEGYGDAVAELGRGTLPVDYLKRVVAAGESMAPQERYAIGSHLDELAGGALKGRHFPSVPGFDDWVANRYISGLYVRRGFSPVTGAEGGRLTVGPRGGVPTALHELTHMQDLEGVFPPDFYTKLEGVLGVKQKDWGQAEHEHIAALLNAVWMGADAKFTKKLPKELRKPLQAVRKMIREADRPEEIAWLNKMPEGFIKDTLEALYVFDRYPPGRSGFHGVGPTFRGTGGIYIPEQRGLPGFAEAVAMGRAYVGSRLGSTVRKGGMVARLDPADPSLTHEFTASLIASGGFHRNMLRASVASQNKAATIHAIAQLRSVAKEIGSPVPSHPSDLFVPFDPARGLSRGERAKIDEIIGLMDGLDNNTPLEAQRMNNLDRSTVEAARDVFFRGFDDDGSTADVAKRLIASKDDTAALEAVMKEFPEATQGVWVPRSDLMNSRVFDARWGNNLAVKGVDAINDYMKAAVLVLKASYIPMNLAGQLTMLLSQQGPLAPLNMARSWAMHSQIGDYAALIDLYSGFGGSKSIYQSRSGIPGLSHTIDLAADISNVVIDKYPRRAAFMYEATRMGYRSPEQLIELLTATEGQTLRDLETVSRRTKRAMVDFDDMSAWEKDVLARIIFVYPWLKGATKWTGHFVEDHPFQAMVAAYMIHRQQEELQEKFPDGYPGYLRWFSGIPGLPDTVERDGKDIPYGIRLDQLFTFLTPLGLGADAVGLATGNQRTPSGASPEGIAAFASPVYDEILKTIQGYDSFTGQPVEGGVFGKGGLLWRTFSPRERFLIYQQIKKARDANEQGIYKANEKDAWLKVGLGSLAPGGIDPTVAAERGAGKDPTPEASREIWRMKAEQALGGKLKPEVLRWKANDQAYNDVVSDYEHELGQESLTDQQRLIALFRTWMMQEGRQGNLDEQALLSISDDAAEDGIRKMRETLGLTQLGSLNSKLGSIKKEGYSNP